MQKELVAAQAEQIVMPALVFQDCGKTRKIKEAREIVYRTLFGKLRLRSPRLMTCLCQGGRSRQSSSPLADALRARVHPELLYLTTRWASIVSYGASRTLLEDVLPVGNAIRRVTGSWGREAKQKWVSRTSCDGGRHQFGCRTRARSRSSFARPYI
jgi:hypothetical protein